MAATPQEIQELRERAKNVEKREKFDKKWIVEAMLRVVEAGALDGTAKLLKAVLDPLEKCNVVSLKATSAKLGQIETLFGLKKSKVPLVLNMKNTYTLPKSIMQNFRDLEDALYDIDSEETCRLRVEYVLVPAAAQARRNLPKSPEKSPGQPPVTPPIGGPEEPKRLPLKIFPELELAVEIMHPVEGKKYEVTGRADWAACYGERRSTGEGTVLLCHEAKKGGLYSTAEAQLITYLAMCRHARMQTRKVNSNVQGFYTDGTLYQFVCIDNDGTFSISKPLDVRDRDDLQKAYDWIVCQLEAAHYSSPTTSLIKGNVAERRGSASSYEQMLFTQFISRPTIYFSDVPGDQPDISIDEILGRKRSVERIDVENW